MVHLFNRIDNGIYNGLHDLSLVTYFKQYASDAADVN